MAETNVLQARFDTILASLKKVRKVQSYYMAQCPAHKDTDRSLTMRWGDNGGILLKCFAGCKFESLCDALGVHQSDLFPPRAQQAHREPEATYDYRDEHSSLVYQVLRYPSKRLAHRRPCPNDPNDWIWNMDGVDRVLYNLPAVLRAARAGKPVFVVEGEKCANCVIEMGLCATTNSGGGGHWDERYSQSLVNAHVVVLRDNDGPGYAHAADIVNTLLGPAASVRLPDLPNLPRKGDVYDWWKAGGTKAQLLEICRAAPILSRVHASKRQGRGDLADGLSRIAGLAKAQWLTDGQLLGLSVAEISKSIKLKS